MPGHQRFPSRLSCLRQQTEARVQGRLSMPGGDYLDWPFFEPRHRELAGEIGKWADSNLAHSPAHSHATDIDNACRGLVRQFGNAGWLKYAIGGVSYGAAYDAIDTRAVCLIRETLARHSGMADFCFALQGLGSGPITLFGSAAQKKKYLPRVAAGFAIAALAISESDAGSDVAALSCAAQPDGDNYILNGEKTWISNGGIADFYTVFVRTGEAPGARGI